MSRSLDRLKALVCPLDCLTSIRFAKVIRLRCDSVIRLDLTSIHFDLDLDLDIRLTKVIRLVGH